MDPNDGRSQPPPDARGEADLAPTTEFRAFLAGDPIPTGAEGDVRTSPGRTAGWPGCEPCSRAGTTAEQSPGRPAAPRHQGRVAGLAGRAPRRQRRGVARLLA